MTLDWTRRWRPLEESGLEHFRLQEISGGLAFRSTLIDTRTGFFYEGRLDPNWTFRAISVRRTDGTVFELVSNGKGSWTANGSPRPDLEGCIDIDLSGSPFTNTLPIRRVDWQLGVSRQFDMAWIDLDAMAARRGSQIYTKLAIDRFHYQSSDSGFAADITIDADGFVAYYPPLFEAL